MKQYLIETMRAEDHKLGKYGPFSVSDRAEQCVVELARRSDILSATIKQIADAE